MKTVAAEDFGAEMEFLFAEMGKGPGQSYMEQIGESLSGQLEIQFGAGETPQGEPWPEWRFRRPESSDSHKTLDDTGRLKDSLVGQTGDSIRFYTSRDLKYGTSVEYAGVHDAGATITTGTWLVLRGGSMWLPPGSTLHIPQRRISGWSEATLQEAAEIIGDGVMQTVFSP